MPWLLQFTVREDEVKQNRRLPEIALFDTDGNQIKLSSGNAIPTWAPSTDYSLGQVVVKSGHLYQAVDDHTSGAVFGGDSAHWTVLDSETDALALAQLATHAGLTTTAHGGIVASSDGRLTNARTPTAHKTSHAVGGSDVLSPADIGAVAASLVDAKGDLIVGTADNVIARFAVGTDGKVLRADSAQAGGVKWDDAVVTRDSMNFSTSSLAANASENDAVALPRQAKLYSITTNRPARVRAYSTSAHRTADASRAVGTDPTGNHGCLLDVVTTSGMLSIDLSPMVDLCNLDSPIADTIYFAVQNLDTGAGIVTTTLTYRREE